MSHICPHPFRALRMCALAAALLAIFPASADDYTDVNQLLRAGRTSEALTRVDQLLVAKPRDPQLRFLRGVIQTESGKTADAIATFTRLTEDYPELPEPHNNLAVLHAGQGQFDKARVALEMAIRTNPSYATAQENLGDVYARLASQAYSKALQLDSANTSLQPKLSLIRELFSPGKAPRPAASAPTAVVAQAPAARPAAAPAPAPVAAPPAAAARPALAPAPATAAAPAPAPAPAPVAAPAAAPAASPAAAPVIAEAATASRDVEAAVSAWASAWSAKNMSDYLSAYGSDFDPPGNQSRKAWEEERRARIVGKSRISVKLSNLQITVDGSKAVAKFRQAYSADGLNVNSQKTLEMQKAGNRWLIVRESTGS